LNDPAMKNKRVSLVEFIDFYTNFSSVVSNEQNFEKLAAKIWNKPRKTRLN
jgi:hypothetical protein